MMSPYLIPYNCHDVLPVRYDGFATRFILASFLQFGSGLSAAMIGCKNHNDFSG